MLSVYLAALFAVLAISYSLSPWPYIDEVLMSRSMVSCRLSRSVIICFTMLKFEVLVFLFRYGGCSSSAVTENGIFIIPKKKN